MNVDPLCPQQHTHPKHNPNRCIFCEYGAAVRVDALQAARDAVAALPDLGKRIWATSDCSCMEYYCFCEHQGKAQALAAIDALRGES